MYYVKAVKSQERENSLSKAYINEVAIINKDLLLSFNKSFDHFLSYLCQSYDSRAPSCIYKSVLLIIDIKNPCLLSSF